MSTNADGNLDRRGEAQRIIYIDIMKALCIMLVIVGHMPFIDVKLKAWIYSYHMPVFFLISGLTFRRKTMYSWKQYGSYLEKKFRSLMLPYALWALIYADFGISNLIKIAYGSHWSLSSAGSLSSLWFLPVLFLADCLAELVLWMIKYVQESFFIIYSWSAFVLGGGYNHFASQNSIWISLGS